MIFKGDSVLNGIGEFPEDIGEVRIEIHLANLVAKEVMKRFITWSEARKDDFLEMKSKVFSEQYFERSLE